MVLFVKERENSAGRLLSRILRHEPGMVGLFLDQYGWANVNELVRCIQKERSFSRAMLEELVCADKKGRYSFNVDHTRVRANYGHSIPVKSILGPEAPPEFLWHGSASRFSSSIKRDGLLPGSRQYVHLSTELEMARIVGARHGEPVIYQVMSGQMYRDGYVFYRPIEGIWQTGCVPPNYLRYVAEQG